MTVVLKILMILFTTLPSIVYSVTYGILFFVSCLITLYKARNVAITIADKFNPVLLIVGLPIIFYVYVLHALAFAFSAWMILYFILRRWSGVSKLTEMQSEASKRLGILERQVKNKEPLKRIKELRARIKYHDHRYWDLDSPEISDVDYDALKRELKALEEEHTKI